MWATTIKSDLEPLYGPRVFGFAQWTKDCMKVSSELAQDRRAYGSSIREVVNSIGDGGSTRPGVNTATGTSKYVNCTTVTSSHFQGSRADACIKRKAMKVIRSIIIDAQTCDVPFSQHYYSKHFLDEWYGWQNQYAHLYTWKPAPHVHINIISYFIKKFLQPVKLGWFPFQKSNHF